MSAALRRLSPRAATGIGAGLLALLATLLFWPLLAGERSLYFGDQGLYFIPQLAFQRRELLEGRIPLWNPHLLLGTPFVSNPQAWPLYPSSLLLYLMPAHQAAGVIGVLHAALAAIGTLLFLRARALGLTASLLGAVAFGFGGGLLSKLQFPNMVQAAAFLPWLLWAVDGLIARPGAGRAALLAALVGLALLAAHAQMFLMQLYLCLAWALWRVRRVPPAGRTAVVRALGAALLVGLLLAAAQLLPVLDLIRSSVRADLTLTKANRFVLPPEMLLTTFLLPNFYGNPATGDYVGRGNFWEPCAYLGLLPFALAVGAAGKGFRRCGEVRFWALAALLGLWLSLGRIGGLYILAFFALPGVGWFHDPARWLHVATFALACLAARGLQALLASLPGRHRPMVAGAALAVTAADLSLFALPLNPTADARVFEEPPAIAAQVDAGRVFHRDNDAVWRRFVRRASYLSEDREQVRTFLHSLAPNLPMLYGLSSADGYEPLRRADTGQLLDRLRRQAQHPDGQVPLLEAVGVRYVLSLRPHRPIEPGAVWARALPDSAPRAALWNGWNTAATAIEARDRFLSAEGSRVPTVPGVTARAPTRAPVPARIGDETPGRLVVLLPVALPREGLLVLTDTWHPGWRAWLANKPATVVPVNGMLRGVFVPAGAREVEFRYLPAVWTVGLFLSLSGLGIVAGVLGFTTTRRLLAPRVIPAGDGGGDVEDYPHLRRVAGYARRERDGGSEDRNAHGER